MTDASGAPTDWSMFYPGRPGAAARNGDGGSQQPVRLLIVSDLAELIGRDVVTVEGAKIGYIGQVHADAKTGVPAWVAVRSGPSGSADQLVPAADLFAVGGDIAVPFTQHQIEDSPAGDYDGDGRLDETSADRLNRYYAMAAQANATKGPPAAGAGSDPNGAGPISGAVIPLRTKEEIAQYNALSKRVHAEAERRRKARGAKRS
jgi:sporulation protein YlmC with PRC-barrel domain